MGWGCEAPGGTLVCINGCLIIRNNNMYGIEAWGGSEWFLRYYAFYEVTGVAHVPRGPSETILQNFISNYQSYPQISEQSVQWVLRTHLDKIWVDLGMPRGTL